MDQSNFESINFTNIEADEISAVRNFGESFNLYLEEYIRRGEIPFKFSYLGEGSKIWDELTKTDLESPDGDIFALSNIITSLKNTLSKYSSVNLIDIGCGNCEPIIGISKNNSFDGLEIGNYFGVDISQEVLQIGERNIVDSPCLNNVNKYFNLYDFETERLSSNLPDIDTNPETANLILFLGGTFGNYKSDDEQNIIINNLTENVDNYFLVLANDTLEEALNNYQEDVEEPEQFTLPLDVLGIDRSYYKVKKFYDPIKKSFRISAVWKKNIKLNFSSRSAFVNIKRGYETILFRHKPDSMESIMKREVKNDRVLCFTYEHPTEPFIYSIYTNTSSQL